MNYFVETKRHRMREYEASATKLPGLKQGDGDLRTPEAPVGLHLFGWVGQNVKFVKVVEPIARYGHTQKGLSRRILFL